MQDGLRVWQWEPPPPLQHDNVDVPWSKVCAVGEHEARKDADCPTEGGEGCSPASGRTCSASGCAWRCASDRRDGGGLKNGECAHALELEGFLSYLRHCNMYARGHVRDAPSTV